VLLREYLDVYGHNAEAYASIGKPTRIDAVEAWPGYVGDLHRAVYSHVYEGSVLDLLPRLPDYDWILAADVLEHMSRENGLWFLATARQRCRRLVLQVPFGEMPQGAIFGNPYERHLSTWDVPDFRGATVEVAVNPSGGLVGLVVYGSIGLTPHVAVTAAPRDGADYLPGCLESVRAAGWGRLTVYAEPGTPEHWPDTRVADHSLGPWPNFQRVVADSLAEPWDYLAVFQDDCLVARGLRPWLEAWLARWPFENTGVVSLYSSARTIHNLKPDRGWFAISRDRLPWTACGAVALLLMRPEAERLAVKFPFPSDRTKTDYHLNNWCRDNGVQWVEHNPSLVSHVGRVSAVLTGIGRNTPWYAARHEGEWAADCRNLAGPG